jgi:PEP-CTERM motif-containing protein
MWTNQEKKWTNQEKNMHRIALAVAVFSSVLPASINAEPVTLGMGGIGGEVSTVEPSVQPGLQGQFFWGYEPFGPGLFGVILTAADIGRTFRATAETDSEFASVAARLTNGVDEETYNSLRFADGQWAARNDVENYFFQRSSPPDLAGATVTAITFRLERFFVIDGPSFRHYHASGILTFEGIPAEGPPPGPGPAPVPEPGTVTLFAAGAAAMLARSRARRTPN